MGKLEIIENNLSLVRGRIDSAVRASGRPVGSTRLVAVTKFRSIEDIQALLSLGVRDIGESRVQEALKKKEALSVSGITWHYIGSLQRKKAKVAASEFDLIHSVSSLVLAESLADAFESKPISILLQVNPLNEPTKQGVQLHEIEPLLEKLCAISSLKVCGLMAMAPIRGSLFPGDVESVFSSMESAFNRMKESFFTSLPHFTELSMGMSQDFEEAIAHGATLVRIGSLLFKDI
jgi:pyridoxal phosphate enzyme (YggS family)